MYVNTRHIILWMATLAFVGAGLVNQASAGMITGATLFGSQAGTGPGLGTVSVPAIVTVNVNNDNVDSGDDLDNNILVPIKRFNANGNIDIQFEVDPTDGITEYKVIENVDNNTGVDWSGYNMYLGFGVGDKFVPSPADDGLDFDYPEFDGPPVSSVMPIVAMAQDSLSWSGGIHGSGAEGYQFRVDVPDLFNRDLLVFTLRQVPVPTPPEGSIPEPGTAALVGCARCWRWRGIGGETERRDFGNACGLLGPRLKTGRACRSTGRVPGGRPPSNRRAAFSSTRP